jgi:hypothetical protein
MINLLQYIQRPFAPNDKLRVQMNLQKAENTAAQIPQFIYMQ